MGISVSSGLCGGEHIIGSKSTWEKDWESFVESEREKAGLGHEDVKSGASDDEVPTLYEKMSIYMLLKAGVLEPLERATDGDFWVEQRKSCAKDIESDDDSTQEGQASINTDSGVLSLPKMSSEKEACTSQQEFGKESECIPSADPLELEQKDLPALTNVKPLMSDGAKCKHLLFKNIAMMKLSVADVQQS